MIYFMMIFELIKKCIINNTDLSNRMSSGIIIGSGFLAKNLRMEIIIMDLAGLTILEN